MVSGGRLIAKKLSEELGITFYDKELIAAVAKKTGFSENFIRDTEHQRPTKQLPVRPLYRGTDSLSACIRCLSPRPK